MTLKDCILCRYSNYSHRTQWTFPHDLPHMPSSFKSNFSSGTICWLCNWISMKCKCIGFNVNVSGWVEWVPCVIKCTKFSFVGWYGEQEVGFECLEEIKRKILKKIHKFVAKLQLTFSDNFLRHCSLQMSLFSSARYRFQFYKSHQNYKKFSTIFLSIFLSYFANPRTICNFTKS